MKKILIADTSSTIKRVAQSLLQDKGFQVTCTSDGLQAWDYITTHKPDLVFTGTDLSGMSGTELCNQISDRAVSCNIPVIIMVGPDDKFSKEDLISFGARGRLIKPFSPNDLLRVVDKIIKFSNSNPKQAEPKSEPSNHDITHKEIYTEKQDVDADQPVVDLSESYHDEEDSLSPDPLQASDSIKSFSELDLSQDVNPKPNMPVENKINEDYDRFVGEKNKDINDPIKNTPIKPSVSYAKSGTESIATLKKSETDSGHDIDDISVSPTKHKFGAISFSDSEMSIGKSKVEETSKPQTSLSDNDIERIATLVSQKLANALVANIDKELILKAITATFEERSDQ